MGDYMESMFIYISIAVIWAVFVALLSFRRIGINHIFIGITTVAYTLVFDFTFGGRLGLYHYVTPTASLSYILLSGVFLYSVLNIIYTMFLPEKTLNALIYTSLWIIGMLGFEYASVLTGTIVFTGWQPIPWSLITYTVTYAWVYTFYRYLQDKVQNMLGTYR